MKCPRSAERKAVALVRSAVGLLVLATLASCGEINYRPSAVGKTGEVIVVADSTLWSGEVGDVLRAELNPFIDTLPNPEPMFDMQHEVLESQAAFDRVSARRNLVFVASLADTTTESDFVRSVFSDEARQLIESGTGVFIDREDTWRRGQRVVYLAARNEVELVEIIRSSAPAMRTLFNSHERRYLEREMYESGRQFDLEDTLLAHHDFRVKVQHDYLIAADTANFVWLRRILPDSWRSVFVYYEEYADPADLTPEWIYRTRDSLGQRYLLGNVGGYIAIDYRRPLEAENIDFLDHYGFEIRGLWHMVGPDQDGGIAPYGMGGPFLSFGFYDQESGRIYLVDGMVFAPGFRKREFLRQLEVIAHTMRTREEIDATVVASLISSPR